MLKTSEDLGSKQIFAKNLVKSRRRAQQKSCLVPFEENFSQNYESPGGASAQSGVFQRTPYWILILCKTLFRKYFDT